MTIRIEGAREHNLQDIDVEIGPGLTAVTGISGSGKTSLVFDTLYHEARRRFLDIYALGRASQRLAPADVDAIAGLGPAVAVGQNLLNRNPESTLASASGLHPFLRLLYANFGERGCPRCGHFSPVLSEDEILARLLSLAARPEQGGLHICAPLVRDTPGSHRTLLGLLVDAFGAAALRVDGGNWDGQPLATSAPHSIEVLTGRTPAGVTEDPVLALREAIRAAARLGAQAVIARWAGGEESMARAPVCAKCGTWLEAVTPTHFHRPCPRCAGSGCDACWGTGLHPAAAAVKWEGQRLTELLALSVDDARARVAGAERGPGAARLLDEIESRLAALGRVGLGYISLDRPSPTLSRGEAQRVRLALILLSRLEDMLHVLDEPTVGQHPADLQRLLPAFRELAGPVVFVEHDRAAVAAADRAIDLGPGAGSLGGRLVYEGTPGGLLAAGTPSGRYFSGRARVQPPSRRPPPDKFITIRGTSLRNLARINVPIPLGRLTVVTGVSGSGKSTLVEDVLAASLAHGAATFVGCAAIEGLPPGAGLQVAVVDQGPIGRNPRSNPATYTKLADVIRDLFASATGLSPSHFSFNRPEGACPACGGLGAIEMPMRYLPGEWMPCAECEGARFSDEVLAATVQFGEGALQRTLSIADFYALTISDVRRLLESETRLPRSKAEAGRRILQALDEIGLGYLPLGQPSPSLSGGEAQRVKLAKTLGNRSLAGQLLILDEPSTGLHPQDLAGLLTVLDRLVRAGATIVVVEHDMDVMRAADWIVDLGPGSGPRGGRVLYAGPPEGLTGATESVTGRMLAADADAWDATEVTGSRGASSEPPGQRPLRQTCISIRGARAHNLRDLDVDFPKGKLTVVTGVSGSGKSSLVHDVLEAEARRRYLESLTLYERQGTREGPEAEADSVTGLGVALTVPAERLVYQSRATVGTATELSHHLAVLLAEAGERTCPQCGAAMVRTMTGRVVDQRGGEWRCPACAAVAPIARPRHFSPATYAAACRTCHGVGTLQAPRPDKLIVQPGKPLCSGAMYSPGFFPNGYLCQPYNHGYYLVQAFAARYGFDPCVTPWCDLPEEVQRKFLFGDPEPLRITAVGHSGRVSEFTSSFPGFYGWIRDWDVGGTYTETKPCPECRGAGLRPEYLAVRLAGYNAYKLSQLPLAQLAAVADSLSLPPGSDRRLRSSLSTLQERLRFLQQVGLGYLHLGRISGTLSAGEAQRIRLASLLGSGLTSLTVLLDEPTRGLHPREVDALVRSLQALRDEGNTVIVVEHDLELVRAADHLVDVGPGAGAAGGRIVAQGTPAEVAQGSSSTGRWLRSIHEHAATSAAPMRRRPSGWLTVRGARANNLVGEAIQLPLGVLLGVCGASGSGKSTLMIDTVGRALAPARQTTSVAYEPVQPGEHDAIEYAPPGARPSRAVLLDQSRAGIHSPATFLDLAGPLRVLYAESEDARSLGLGVEAFAASCSACDGKGVIALDMGFLPDVHVPCETCRGTGHLPEAWQVRVHGLSLPEVFGLTIDQASDVFGEQKGIGKALAASRELGLGYLVLRQPGYALSGGEAQRLRIAAELVKRTAAGTLYILDEPSLGQHLEDIQWLTGVLSRLVDAGASVMVVEHHPHVLDACDWLVELGPGGGPDGGRVIASGTPEEVGRGSTPMAPYLREIRGW